MPKPWWRETIETVFWALILALILRTFVIQAFWIPSGSMIPTLEIGGVKRQIGNVHPGTQR